MVFKKIIYNVKKTNKTLLNNEKIMVRGVLEFISMDIKLQLKD